MKVKTKVNIHVKKGEEVVIIAGSNKGKRGKESKCSAAAVASLSRARA